MRAVAFLGRLHLSASVRVAEAGSVCLAFADRNVAGRTRQRVVFDIQAGLTGRLDKWSAGFVQTGRTWSVERQIVVADVGRKSGGVGAGGLAGGGCGW